MPPKSKRSKSPESPFMFVNEDAATLNRKTKDFALDRTKQSHVQRQNFARKRRMQDDAKNSRHRPIQQTSASATSVEEGQSQNIPSSSGSEYFNVLQHLDMAETSTSTSPSPSQAGVLDPRLFMDLFNSPISSVHVPQSKEAVHGFPHAYQPGNFFDTPIRSPNTPFAQQKSIDRGHGLGTSTNGLSSPTRTPRQPLEEWAPALIAYHNQTVLPEQFWMETGKVSLSQMRHASSIHTDMQACMAEPAHMYAFLASAATQMIEREGKILVRGATEQDIQRIPAYFKHKAIRALRVKLGSSKLDHSVAIDVHRLYMTTYYSETGESAEPHFHALLSMVESLGGLNTFNDYQLENIVFFDCYTALERMEPPRLLETWDPGSLTVDQLLAIDEQLRFHAQPASRFDKTLLDMNQNGISSVLTEVVEVLKMSSFLTSLPEYFPDYHKWLTRRGFALLHRCLSMPSTNKLSAVQDSLRMALIYWIATCCFPARGRVHASSSVYLLKERLEETSLHNYWHPHSDHLLWISVFGGICAIQDDDELEFYVTLARSSALRAGIHSFEELEDLFSTLLYEPKTQQDPIKDFSELIWPH
ncbi:hypothetical protein LTR84_008463 [Exophiala bonariae]|uniref:Transcription factor domain-containing protein n=1 Tax=Exophiala bonariae TaxID=1690606 RepID=A0AAV9MYF6_9EURO|nr:hypothetical protein LTR84_008463 [Exophiala bonariae]